jgi:hypothetical protein
MNRIAFVLTSLVLLPSFAYADQQVRAAWYGNELRGHRTASGEMFNPNGVDRGTQISALRHVPRGRQS